MWSTENASLEKKHIQAFEGVHIRRGVISFPIPNKAETENKAHNVKGWVCMTFLSIVCIWWLTLAFSQQDYLWEQPTKKEEKYFRNDKMKTRARELRYEHSIVKKCSSAVLSSKWLSFLEEFLFLKKNNCKHNLVECKPLVSASGCKPSEARRRRKRKQKKNKKINSDQDTSLFEQSKLTHS